MRYPYNITENGLSVFLDGTYVTMSRGHASYKEVREHLLEAHTHDREWLKRKLDMKAVIADQTFGRVTVHGSTIMYDGRVVHDVLTKRMVSLLTEGRNIEPWALFMDKLYQNPSERSRESLYSFLEKFEHPITPDGDFLAFKKVRGDYKDIYTGTMDNSPGTVVEVSRESVDPDPNRTCSEGLHVCAESYLGSYGTASSNTVVVVKINPADVVAVPEDYNHAKMRVCRYEVLCDLVQTGHSRDHVSGKLIDETFTDYYGEDEEDMYEDEDFLDVSDDDLDSTNDPESLVFEHAPTGQIFAEEELVRLVKVHSQRGFSRKYGIPRSTVQGWLSRIGE